MTGLVLAVTMCALVTVGVLAGIRLRSASHTIDAVHIARLRNENASLQMMVEALTADAIERDQT